MGDISFAVDPDTQEKICIFKHTVLFNETNAMGGVVYFANFVKWQGMARELVMREATDYKKILARPVEMITHSCSVKYIGHLFFGDRVKIEVRAHNVLPTSFVMSFRYYNEETNEMVATGEQKVTFANIETHQLCPIPEEILALVKMVESKKG